MTRRGVFTPARRSYVTFMFADLLRRLTAPEPEQVDDADARLALGALLVRIARSDGDYAQVEKDSIRDVLATRYSDADTNALITECEALEDEAPDTVRFTRAIKDAVAYDDRLAVVEAMWEVVLADGVRSTYENQLMRLVPPLIGIEDMDSHMARRKVEARK